MFAISASGIAYANDELSRSDEWFVPPTVKIRGTDIHVNQGVIHDNGGKHSIQ